MSQIDRLPRDLTDDSTAQDQNTMNKTESLKTWILRERFPKFVKVTRGKFSQLMSTKKLLVMAVLEENKLGELAPDHEAFRSMLNTVLEMHIDKYRQHFQFGWTGSPDLANSVAMDTLSVSSVFLTFRLKMYSKCFSETFVNKFYKIIIAFPLLIF